MRTQYAVRMRPHLCHRLSDFVCLFEFFLGGGRVYSEGGVRKGVVFRILGLFGQRCSAMVTKPLIKEFLKSCRVLFLLIPENVDTICWHKLRSLRSVSRKLRLPVSASSLL